MATHVCESPFARDRNDDDRADTTSDPSEEMFLGTGDYSNGF
jgi:hypothetical protein